MSNEKTVGLEDRVSDFAVALLRGYGSVLFCSSSAVGAVLLAATFFSPVAGMLGLAGATTALLTAMALRVHRPIWMSGIFGCNGLLVGLAWARFYEFEWSFLVVFILCAALSAVVLICLLRLLGATLELPALSIAFVVCTWIAVLALQRYESIDLPVPAFARGLSKFILEFERGELAALLPRVVLDFFSTVSAAFFRTSPLFGLAAFCAVLLFSPMTAVLAAWGYIFALACITWSGWSSTPALIAGFNAMLTAIALGGVFVVVSLRSFVLASAGVLLAVFLTACTAVATAKLGLQPLAAPFNLAVLLILLSLRSGMVDTVRAGLIPIPLAVAGTPEQGLEWHIMLRAEQEQRRPCFSLPFYGTWKVSQGVEGKHTHREAGRFAWDFVVVDEAGETHSGPADRCAAFYAFGLPVLAPAAGTVVKVVANVSDNVPPAMNTAQNWGNYVVISHPAGATAPPQARQIYRYIPCFSVLAHLMQNSVKVREGEQVSEGQAIGLCGNSGRADEPHIHFQVQLTAPVGGLTIPVEFCNFLDGPARPGKSTTPGPGAAQKDLEQPGQPGEAGKAVACATAQPTGEGSASQAAVDRTETAAKSAESTGDPGAPEALSRLVPLGMPQEGRLVVGFAASLPDAANSILPFVPGRKWQYALSWSGRSAQRIERLETRVRLSGEYELAAAEVDAAGATSSAPDGRVRSQLFRQVRGMLYFDKELPGGGRGGSREQHGLSSLLGLFRLGTGQIPLDPRIGLAWEETHRLRQLLPWWKRMLPLERLGVARHRFVKWEMIELKENTTGTAAGTPDRAGNSTPGVSGSSRDAKGRETNAQPLPTILLETAYFPSGIGESAEGTDSPVALEWTRRLWVARGHGIVRVELRRGDKLVARAAAISD
ncbi:MAG: urea transporter [Planctomycetota bacterium]|nr:urea transporter [Planctomycetota bacterium]